MSYEVIFSPKSYKQIEAFDEMLKVFSWNLKAPMQYAIADLFRLSNLCPFHLKHAAQATYEEALTCVF